MDESFYQMLLPMVEIRTPAKAAAAVVQNPSDKGQIFTPLFDQSSLFNNLQRENQNPNPIRPMDQPTSYQFPPFSSSSDKPSLSKPRLVKQRKNSGQRKQPPAAAVQEPDQNPSLNPFRTEKIEEKVSSWNPFMPESGARVSEGPSGNVANFDTGRFVFGSPNLSRNSSGQSVGSFDSAKSVFSSDAKKNDDLVRDSSVGTNEGLDKEFDKLKDEMEKLGLKNPGNRDDFKGRKHEEKAFAFEAGSVDKSSEMKKSVDLSSDTRFGSMEGPSFNIHDEMRKLNLKKTSEQSANNLERNASASVAGSVMGSKPINAGLGKPTVGSVSFGGKESGTDAGTFVFGSGVKKSVNLSQDSSIRSGEGLFSKLPDQMSQMNLSSEDDLQKANIDATGSFGSSNTNRIPQKAEKLDFGRDSATQSMKNGSAASAAGSFTFGSSSGKTSTDTKMNSECLEKGKETSSKAAFGTSKNTSASYGGSAINSLHDDLEKLKIGRNAGNVAGSVPVDFIYQAGKGTHRSNMGTVPSSSDTGFQSPGLTFSSTSKPRELETPHMEFNTPKQDASRLTKETLFTGVCQSRPFSAKKGDAKGTRTKNKKKTKARQPVPLYQNFSAQFVSEERGPEVNPEVDSGDYSPMDYSPYREDVIDDQYSREPSVASEDATRFFSRAASTDTQRLGSGDEQEDLLVSAAQRLNIIDSNRCKEEVGNEASEDNDERRSNARSRSTFVDEQSNIFGNGNDFSVHENVTSNDIATAPMEAEADLFCSNVEGPATEDRTEFTFLGSLGGLGESNFSFSASPFVQGPSPAVKQNHRKKYKLKSDRNPSSTLNTRVPLSSAMPDLIPRSSTSGIPDPFEGLQSTSFVPQSGHEINMGKTKETRPNQEPTSSADASVTEQEACEKWRFRGNQAYANGHLTKAEDYYTRGVNSVSLNEIPSSCFRPLTLCYSNRAATRMSLGKMRAALNDCMMAVSIDPNFLKAQVRLANCHLALGEIEEALKHFKKCLQADKNITPDRKYLSEASDGLQKAQQVANLTGQSAELLLRRTPNDASKALNMVCEALSISPHSESLLQMKAEALLMMRKYEDVIKLCEQTLDLAELNSDKTETDSQFMNRDYSESLKGSPASLWRWSLTAKSYFYLGKLEEALELLQKHAKLKSVVNKSPDSSASFAVTIKELLRLKSAGNEAFQAARHSDAVEYYSSALACSAESRPFTAVCFCNRAAAYQALGQIADAIADCSLAIALDAGYAKAISRRATLHEMIRDYGQASHDLSRLISLLEMQTEEKVSQSSGVGRSAANCTDLKRARARLTIVEAEARKGASLNMYMILGIEPSSSAADVKKAYRKAALRHHPDKAGQQLVRNDNVDDGVWRDVAAEVHSDADRLFKMIGEAYAILSDPAKRLQYDSEEEMRTCPTSGYNTSSPKSSSDKYSGYYEKGFNRRQWRGSSYQRW